MLTIHNKICARSFVGLISVKSPSIVPVNVLQRRHFRLFQKEKHSDLQQTNVAQRKPLSQNPRDVSLLTSLRNGAKSMVDRSATYSNSMIIASSMLWPHNLLQGLVNSIHVWSGMPWWASIATMAIGMRITVLPLMLNMIRTSSKLAVINPQVSQHMVTLQRAKAENNSTGMSEATSKIQDLYRSNNVNPLSLLSAPMVQGVIFISFFYALKCMAGVPVDGLTEGGFLWVQDLTKADPYAVFPILNGFLMLFNIEAGSETGTNKAAMAPGMKRFFRLLCAASPIFTMSFPMAIFMYWVPSNIFSVFQGLLLKNQSVRNKLDLPEVPAVDQKTAPQNESFLRSFTSIMNGVREQKKYPEASDILKPFHKVNTEESASTQKLSNENSRQNSSSEPSTKS
ncbi:inner membrane translocase Oxa102 [Schizosaccharomyces cryophilus OY26]|uniref:Inner membrane translocase Oxa102 n=1 Tax=Schizosaccharomyces cryophilus (strain OY26 / ATCC MYA-4695 / CBS 11777 / NBRC 106824 / NRRL Y48691) TaxID=653667 RepID=S9W5J2_SCHCR|nr:inner membrane translocase Oxa102 [Schizosaccharomyces cryophilus OY26]EPY53819.1 inner membrane translocase Oxa102 [Schizosaccharomyces cryophilus OY26]